MIYLLGGRGFVGSALTRYCQRYAIDHVVLTRENYANYKGSHCDLFINANGNSEKLRARERPVHEFDESVRSVRASLVDFSTDSYVYLSSCDVYPDCSCPETTAEDCLLDPARQSPYGFHKSLAEQCVRHAARHWLILRLGGLVGPGLWKNPIFDILNGGPLWVDPASELQYLHTDDLAAILFELLERKLDRRILNVCGQGLVCLRDVIDWSGRAPKIQQGSPKVRYDVSIARLREFVPVLQSRQTVLDFVRWWVQGSGEKTQEELPDDHFANALAD